MINKAICAARASLYAAYEPARLRWERQRAFGYFRFPWCIGDPLVTCYVPTFNRVELLMERALPSMLAQTYKNIEIIVVCHGCTDGTAQSVRYTGWESEGNDHRPIRVLEIPRRRTYPSTVENHWLAGPVVPANAALNAARGAWIARIDDDDTWTPDHVEKLLRFAQRGDYEFVSAAYNVDRAPATDDEALEIVHHDGEDQPIGGVQTWLCRSYLRFMRFNIDCWRKKWNKVNDVDLADRFRKAGVRIGHLDEPLAYVRPRPGETTVGLDAYKRDAKAKEKHFSF